MDDTFIHAENAWQFVSNLNASEPALIGERFCHPNFEYPTGGPGFIISRGLIDAFDFKSWTAIQINRSVREGVFDDLVWGQLLQRMNVSITHHNGFSQTSASLGNPMFNYMTGRTSWNLPFRPIAYHQGPHKFSLMSQLQDVLHRLPYEELDPYMIELPPCKCWPMDPKAHELRCTTSPRSASQRSCGGGLRYLKCLTGR